MELINYYLQDDRLLSLDDNLLRYGRIKISSCIEKDYYDNVVHLLWDLEEISKDFIFPKALRKITFEYNFNSNVNNIPHNVTHLFFGMDFNQKIDLSRLKKLEHLEFGLEFDRKLKNIPKCLKTLKLWRGYTRRLRVSKKIKLIIY